METQVQRATHPHDPWAATHQVILQSATMDPKQRFYNHFLESITGESGCLSLQIFSIA
jgi:hypothetical protein